ncbi:mechanosensitive ion channel family protein [Ahrensia sp. R2A130]|uniref:mechanosensitive ion channel family protein n=1 Tax=Ahrensia sp. R2A130 TaxID=744979 RepID=UPI0001E0BC35|nr:mechanosensitive ion channel domain-containing protein [Ahrensia sp. R2A130]EFL90743.1 MscS mechanosensitive ion channel [Ahrensia sp. R2A130]
MSAANIASTPTLPPVTAQTVEIGGGDLSQELVETGEKLALSLWQTIYQPWTLYQLGIVIALYLVCLAISKQLEPPLENWVRGLKLNSGFLRVLAALLRRVEWILFVPACYLAWVWADSVTYPWNTFILRSAYLLAAAWLVINVASRVIRSRPISRTIAMIAWIIVALSLTGYLAATQSALDAVAFSAGEVRISLLVVMKAVALLVILVWLASNTGNYAETRIRRMTDLTPSLQVLMGKLIKIFLVIMAIVVSLNSVGIDLTAFAVFSGAIGVGLGFGLQKVVSNFISGVIILLDKSIKPGDTIQLDQTFGWVRELRSRFVSVVTRDGREFLIPNEDFITEKVINWSYTDNLVRLDVDFGVSYDSNPHQVSELSIEAINALDRVSSVKKPVCWMTEFGDSSLNFKARFWISDPQNGLTNIRGLVMLALWDAFKENDIGIPFPHREIIMRTPVEVSQPPTED